MSRLFSLVVLAALVAGGFWWWDAGAEAADDLVLRVGEPQCEGTRLEAGPDGGDGPVVVAVRPMRCTYPVTVRNGGQRQVRLGSVDADDLGRGDTLVRSDTPRDQQRIESRLEPGESVARELVVVLDETGASPAGLLEVEPPSVSGTLWARPFSVTAERPLLFRVPPRLGSDA